MIPFLPNRYPDESPVSFFTRLAFEVGHASMVDVIRGRSGIRNHRDLLAAFLKPQKYQELMRSLGIEKELPKPIKEKTGEYCRSYIFDGIKINLDNFRGDLESFCPECLRSSPYWRRQWSLRVYTVCAIHGCDMVELCTRCNLSLTDKRSCIFRCRECNFDLRDTKPVYTTERRRLSAHKLFTTEINSLELKIVLNVFTSLDKTFKKQVTDKEKMNIVNALLEKQDDATQQLHRVIAENIYIYHPRIQLLPLLLNRVTASTAEAVLQQLGNIKFDSPSNSAIYYLSISEAAKALNVSRKMIKDLISWNILPFKGIKTKNRVSSDAITLLLDKTPQDLKTMLDKATGNEMDTSREVSVSEAAALLNTTSAIVCGLRRTNHLVTSIRMIHGQQKNMVDIDSIKQFKQKYIISGAIAKNFDLSIQTVNLRLKAIGIFPVSGPSIDGAITNIFKTTDLHEYTKAKIIDGKIMPKNNNRDHTPNLTWATYVTEKAAAVTLGVGLKMIKRLMDEGILKCTVINQNTLIEKQSLKDLQKTLKNSEYMELHQVRKAIGVNPGYFWTYFVNTGIVSVVEIFYHKLVHKKCVDRLMEITSEYMTPKEAITKLGIKGGVLTCLREKSVVKFKHFQGIRYDIYFYLKKDIENLIKFNINQPQPYIS